MLIGPVEGIISLLNNNFIMYMLPFQPNDFGPTTIPFDFGYTK
jgi:hypothetical protein